MTDKKIHNLMAYASEHDHSMLACPSCGVETSMHMDDLRVIVDIGDGEGEEEFHFPEFERGVGPLREVKGGKVSRPNKTGSRGGSISLRLWCDCCGSMTRLTLGFHKGTVLSAIGFEGNYYQEKDS